MFELTEKDIRRLWSKIERRRKNQCWPWKAKARLQTGYGVLKFKTGQQVVASRLVCFLAHGPAPEGKPHALHSCDNPSCCNPAHLRWGSQHDNVLDAIERNRASPPPRNAHYRKHNPRRGEDVSNSKLTEPIVREIWRLHLEGRNASEIATSVGHTVAAVYDVCRGRSWRHLPGAPSIEALKAGGVKRGVFNQFSNGGDTRALNPRTKIPSSEIPAILSRIEHGETLQEIGKTYGVLKSAVWAIKKKYAA